MARPWGGDPGCVGLMESGMTGKGWIRLGTALSVGFVAAWPVAEEEGEQNTHSCEQQRPAKQPQEQLDGWT